jgi:endonuclease YncB( thermonuclease family)
VRRDVVGSLVLLAVVAALVLRPWEGGGEEEGPRAVTAAVTRVVDGDTFEARVVDGDTFEARVVDGDTFEARIGGEVEDVRLIGVDTPETVKPGTPVQCFGPRASRFAHELLEGRRVRLVFGAERRDAYGRLLAYAYLPAGAPVAGSPAQRRYSDRSPARSRPPSRGDSPTRTRSPAQRRYSDRSPAQRRRSPEGASSPHERSLFVNATLVRRGLARTLTIPPNDRFAPRLRRLELAAARAGRGLWGACPP